MSESLSYPKLERIGRPQKIVLLPERLWQARAEWQAVPVMDDRMVRPWWDYVRHCHSNPIKGDALTCRDTMNLLVPASPVGHRAGSGAMSSRTRRCIGTTSGKSSARSARYAPVAMHFHEDGNRRMACWIT